MRKLLFLIMVASAFVMQSCDPKSKGTNGDALQFVYNLTATAEGQVEFSWPNGGADVNGNAKLWQSNDTAQVLLKNQKSVNLSEALASNDAEVSKAAEEVNSLISVKGVEGEYKLALKGYVKYGSIVFAIDETYPKE